MDDLMERLQKLAEERARVERQEAQLIEDARVELEAVTAEIARLEERKTALQALIGIDDGESRAERGEIQRLCLDALSRLARPATSGEIREEIDRSSPGVKLTSVPATLSRLALNGRLQRDEFGRYSLLG